MKYKDELRAAFPKTDAEFRNAVQGALDRIESESMQRGTRRMPWIFAAAAVMVFIATAGVALSLEHWGIADFIRNHEIRKISMNSTVVADIPAFEPVIYDTTYARMTVKEAIYDGYGVYLLVEAEALREGTMLVSGAFQYDEPAHISVSGAPSDMTIAEYAESIGYDRVASVALKYDTTTAHYYKSRNNEDGTVSFMIWAYVQDEFRNAPELKMELELYTLGVTTQYSSRVELRLQRAGACQRVQSTPVQPVKFEHVGVTVNSVELLRTPITTYVNVSWEINDALAYEHADYRVFQMMDMEGKHIPLGANPISVRVKGGFYGLGEDNGYLGTLMLEELPDTIVLEERGRDGEAKTRHSFCLQ